MALEWLGYTDKEARNEKARSLKAAGFRHVTTYSTHENGGRVITWVVCWDEPAKTTAKEST
jgi:hypothetical protein